MAEERTRPNADERGGEEPSAPVRARLRPDAVTSENAALLDRLVRSIDLAEGFALFFARCNAPALRDDLALAATQRLAVLGVEVVEVAFEDEPTDVRQRLRAALLAADEAAEPIPVELPLQSLAVAETPAGYTVGPKRAVFVVGLELGIPYGEPNSRILAELNLGRDLFPRDVPHPLVLWLPDYALTAVARHAPDFWAWRSGVFEFATSEQVRRSAYQQYIWRDRSWYVLTNLTPEARLLRQRQLESLLDDYRNLPDGSQVTRERADILADLGDICSASQNYSETIAYYQQALALQRQVDDRSGEATTLSNIGAVYSALGDKRQALDFYKKALPLRQQVGDQNGEATTLSNIGAVYDALGDKRQALDYYERALELTRQVGDREGEATTLNNIGFVYDDLGEKHRALTFYEQALLLQRQAGDQSGEATTLSNIGYVYSALGDKHKALDLFGQALSLSRHVGDRGGEAATLNNIGLVYDALGEKHKALRHYEDALVLRRQVSDQWGERGTRYDMAMTYESLGGLAQAEEQLTIVVALDEAIEYPDLASDRAALERIRAKCAAGG